MMPVDYRKLIGDGKCLQCHRPLGQIFWRLRIDRGVINTAAVRRQMGLAMFLGSDVLADIMGPGEQLVAFTGDVEPEAATLVCLCDDCVGRGENDLAVLIETANDRATAQDPAPAVGKRP